MLVLYCQEMWCPVQTCHVTVSLRAEAVMITFFRQQPKKRMTIVVLLSNPKPFHFICNRRHNIHTYTTSVEWCYIIVQMVPCT